MRATEKVTAATEPSPVRAGTLTSDAIGSQLYVVQVPKKQIAGWRCGWCVVDKISHTKKGVTIRCASSGRDHKLGVKGEVLLRLRGDR